MDGGKFMEAGIDSGGDVSPERKSVETAMARERWERRTDEG